jgi:hypothetical protein
MDEEMRTTFGRHRKIRVFRILLAVFAGMSFVSLFAATFGWVVMLLWNWLMPSIFDLKEITYWQAFGITVLSKILLSAHHGMPHPGKYHSDEIHRKVDDRWHRWLGVERGVLCEGRFSRDDLKYYKDFWRDQGEKAFEEYLKMKNEK